MAVTINGDTGVTTPGISNSEGYTGDGLTIAAGAPSGAVAIDSSGNVGIGTSSPTAIIGTARVVDVVGTTYGFGLFGNGTVTAQIAGDGANGLALIGSRSNHSVSFIQNNTERARIDSSGNFMTGCTNTNGANNAFYGSTGDIQKIFSTQTSSASYSLVAMFSNATTPTLPTGTLRVNITTNGGIANYQANNSNLSDRREKTNFAPAGEYLSKICAIPVQTFNYIDQNLEEDPGLTLGVVAQDVQEVAPELVMESNWGTEEEPKTRLSIYQTDLQYALMKCIQEQQAIINAQQAALTQLQADVAALKGQA